jgi:V/A-type H+-transporting ATPase subunit F
MGRYRFQVVTRAGDGLGFRLAGAPVEELDEASAPQRFRTLLSDPGLGVIAVDESLLAAVPEPLLEKAAREGLPVLFPFRLPRRWEEAAGGGEYVATLIRRAIGYHVKIQR